MREPSYESDLGFTCAARNADNSGNINDGEKQGERGVAGIADDCSLQEPSCGPGGNRAHKGTQQYQPSAKFLVAKCAVDLQNLRLSLD